LKKAKFKNQKKHSTMDNFEKHISRQLQNDKLPFSANPGILDRLIYHLQLKSANSAVHRNQILPSLSVLFATKLLAWKVGVATLLLISFMGYKQFNHHTSSTHIADTVQIMQAIDTTHFIMEDSAYMN